MLFWSHLSDFNWNSWSTYPEIRFSCYSSLELLHNESKVINNIMNNTEFDKLSFFLCAQYQKEIKHTHACTHTSTHYMWVCAFNKMFLSNWSSRVIKCPHGIKDFYTKIHILYNQRQFYPIAEELFSKRYSNFSTKLQYTCEF